MRLRKSKESSGWSSGDVGKQKRMTPIQRLREEFSNTIERLTLPLRIVFKRKADEPFHKRFITFGELGIDAAMTPVGRTLVSAGAVFCAWLLLSI